MPNKNYERGRAFEYRTRDALMAGGAVYVMRAAGSHTIADLAAFFPASCGLDDHLSPTITPSVWLVQCKRDGRLSAEDRETLVSLCYETGARPYLAKAGPGGRGVILEEVT